MMQELNYIRCGDYYIPDIRLPEETRPIGRWGRMHRDYIKEHMYSLQPIRQEANYSILLETLAAYLLDAGENLQRTAEVLGVHKNTVRYRLNQIRASYACEISQMPLVAELYEAVALQRLLSNN